MPRHLHLAPRQLPDGPPASVAAAIRVVLSEGHAGMGCSLRQLLEGEQGIEVVSEAGDVVSLLRKTRAHRPHVVVFDLDMPGRSGTEGIAQLRTIASGTQIVVTTMKDDAAYSRSAFGAGALGFVAKGYADDELGEAIRAAARGEVYLSPALAAQASGLRSWSAWPAGPACERTRASPPPRSRS